MGKYDSVVKTLPKTIKEDRYQDKINEIKKEFAGKEDDPSFLGQAYVVARKALQEEKEILSLLQQRVTALEQLLINSEDQADEGWGQFGAKPNMLRLKSGVSISVTYEPVGKVEDREAFRLWCIANGLEKSLMLWPSTMVSLVKEKLLAGEPTPEGIRAVSQPKIVARGIGLADADE